MTILHCTQQTGFCGKTSLVSLPHHRIYTFYLDQPVMWRDLAHLAPKKNRQHPRKSVSLNVVFPLTLLFVGQDALAKAKEGQREAIGSKKRVPTRQTPGVVIPSRRSRTFCIHLRIRHGGSYTKWPLVPQPKQTISNVLSQKVYYRPNILQFRIKWRKLHVLSYEIAMRLKINRSSRHTCLILKLRNLLTTSKITTPVCYTAS